MESEILLSKAILKGLKREPMVCERILSNDSSTYPMAISIKNYGISNFFETTSLAISRKF